MKTTISLSETLPKRTLVKRLYGSNINQTLEGKRDGLENLSKIIIYVCHLTLVKMLILCICVMTMAGLTDAFKPNSGLDDDSAMYSHAKITEEALDIVAATFLTSTDQVTTTRTTEYDFVIKSHFGEDGNSYKKYKTRARQFASAVSAVYKTYKSDPDYTVNSERIREAHALVQETRLEIGTLLSGTLTVHDVSVLIQKIAKCLLIIQSFYSSTNWVEMNGADPYSDFGSPATQDLMQLASSHDKTCSSCDDSSSALRQSSCNNNLLVHDRLTSGYWYGQTHSPKPSAGSGETDGKCSHGGLWDSGKDTPATGGINKATTDPDVSPHYHLHQQAAEAAVQATVEFFIHQTSGILTDISNHAISRLIGLDQLNLTPSLGFVIDVSGSMGDDITAVKSSVTRKVNDARTSGVMPGKYVLATFSDPEGLTTVRSTTDGDEMVKWLEELSVGGGGDCPEYAMSGLLAAIGLSEINSRIFLATDADAKDPTLSGTVMSAATTKGVKVEFLLTGSCSRYRRDISLRQKRDLASFQTIADGTGGAVFRIGSSELSTVLDELLEENFTPTTGSIVPSSTAVVDFFIQTLSESDSIDIYVDSEASSVVISIAGPFSLTEATLTDPSGTVETFSTGNATRYYGSYTVTMTIQNPTPGAWVLTRTINRQWEVNVTMSTTLDIDYQLIETDDSGIHYVSDRNPIEGNNYTLAVIAYNLDSSSTSFVVNLLDEDGSVRYNTTIYIMFEASKTVGYTAITVPSTNFYVQFSGIDQNGFQFERMVGTLVIPVTVDLFVRPIFGNLAVGTPQDIIYTLSNFGSAAGTYTVTIVDDKGRALYPVSRDHNVNSGDNVTENFQLSSATELEQITYTVSVTSLRSSIVLQSTTYTAMVTGPFCTSLMTSTVCREANTGGTNCSSFTWSATAVFSYDIWVYVVDDDVTVTIDTVDKKRLHINGTCCVANFTVNASPTTGSGCQVTQLVAGVTMSTSQSVVNDESSGKADEDDKYLTVDTGTNIGMIAGILVGVGVIVLAVTGLLKYVTRKKDGGNSDAVIEFEEDAHADTSQRTVFDPNQLNPKALEAMFTAPPPQATTLSLGYTDMEQDNEKTRRQLFEKYWN
ncbi:von Willebrand factor A domain-containing protein 7-like [Argopecten irradians]|uniref:von Willebrand factor A domain-containing protein 7-like n=1 Tax=Argopecten irradians TaxID=31199 RepID=UPI00371CBD07